MRAFFTSPLSWPLVATLLLLWLPARSQGLDTLLVSASYRQTPVGQVLRDLSSRYNVRIHFREAWVANQHFTGQYQSVGLLELVGRAVQGAALEPIVIRREIYLAPRYDVLRAMGRTVVDRGWGGDPNGHLIMIGNPSDAGRYRLFRVSGVVRDGASGETIIGATIRVANTQQHAVTDFDGEYSLELAPGTYELIVASLGFEERRLEVRAVGPGRLDVDVFESTHELSEVRIYAQGRDQHIRGNQMSLVALDARTIRQLPSVVGERDIVKSLTMWPGVKSVGEFGAGINVRGGGDDQNLYLLEGAPIFNTSHVMGLLSAFNPDAVTSLSLHKGHVPAAYGERVSSVMNIGMRDYSIDAARVKGGIGIFSSRLLVETPALNDVVTLRLGARGSYSDYLLGYIPDYNVMNSSARFHDLSGVVSLNLRNNPITLMGYRSHNYFRYVDIYTNRYENTAGSLSWAHLFTPDLSTDLTLAYSRYGVEREDTHEELFASGTTSGIEYLSGKLNLRYTGLRNHTIDIGAQAIRYHILPGTRTPLAGSWAPPFASTPELGTELAAYANDVFEVSPRLSLQVGLRYSHFHYLGPQTIYHYQPGMPRLLAYRTDSTVYRGGDVIAAHRTLEPRLSLRWMVDSISSIRMSYNRNAQYLSLMAYSSIPSPEDTWKLSDPFIPPIIADQVALGYYRSFADNTLEASVEVYAKRLRNLVEFRNGAQLGLNNHLETELLDARGFNYGVEFQLSKTHGSLRGNLTYTYSRALKQTLGADFRDRINRNEWYPSPYDKPHDLNISAIYNVNRRLRFGVNFAFSTGRPITLPEYIYRSGSNNLVFFSDRNKYRLPNYHRLDLSISLDENLRRRRMWKGSWTFSLLNVYARKNPYTVFYRHDVPTPENNFQMFSLYKLYLIGVPLPSLTYNFIF